ncbi:MAG: Maf family protein [Candidatus Coatesbacteria bacterium]
MTRPRPLYLASASPRRIDLLSRLGLPFRVLHLRFREIMPSLPAEEAARLLAWRKAEWARRHLDHGIIVAADTIVALGDHLYGKPRSRADAAAMLRELSGRTHLVTTAVAVVDARTRCGMLGSERSRVTFRRLSSKDISRYVASGESLDKAGAYAVQGLGRALLARIEGDVYNVIGFPVHLFASLAERLGVRVPPARVRALYLARPR